MTWHKSVSSLCLERERERVVGEKTETLFSVSIDYHTMERVPCTLYWKYLHLRVCSRPLTSRFNRSILPLTSGIRALTNTFGFHPMSHG